MLKGSRYFWVSSDFGNTSIKSGRSVADFLSKYATLDIKFRYGHWWLCANLASRHRWQFITLRIVSYYLLVHVRWPALQGFMYTLIPIHSTTWHWPTTSGCPPQTLHTRFVVTLSFRCDLTVLFNSFGKVAALYVCLVLAYNASCYQCFTCAHIISMMLYIIMYIFVQLLPCLSISFLVSFFPLPLYSFSAESDIYLTLTQYGQSDRWFIVTVRRQEC